MLMGIGFDSDDDEAPDLDSTLKDPNSSGAAREAAAIQYYEAQIKQLKDTRDDLLEANDALKVRLFEFMLCRFTLIYSVN